MSILDKAKDKAQQLIGEVKEKVGEKTGNQTLRVEGQADQVEGHAKETGHDLRDKTADGVAGLKDKFNR
ncbi:CsbD family protein [Umezawaea sp. NPDC059074]|uniref:CsbD family protein n=1 Tax=Umezawaea sp. NPDC059074 TaxID=3346716 RepID=UPI0036A8EBC0